jgi:hypothetical protein
MSLQSLKMVNRAKLIYCWPIKDLRNFMHVRTDLLLNFNMMIFLRINLMPLAFEVLVCRAIRPVFSWVIEILSSFKNRNNSILSYFIMKRLQCITSISFCML